jgi:hypothetical protein
VRCVGEVLVQDAKSLAVGILTQVDELNFASTIDQLPHLPTLYPASVLYALRARETVAASTDALDTSFENEVRTLLKVKYRCVNLFDLIDSVCLLYLVLFYLACSISFFVDLSGMFGCLVCAGRKVSTYHTSFQASMQTGRN